MSSYRSQGHRIQRDANEGVIVRVFEELGFYIAKLDEPCDLLVQCGHGHWLPVEVKNPETTPTRGRRANPEGLTRRQRQRRKGMHHPIAIVSTADETRALAQRWCHYHSYIPATLL